MSARYLVDTHILSEELLPRPSSNVTRRLKAHSAELVTASVVWHELWYGANRLAESNRRRAIERHLLDVVATLPILPYDEQAALWHAMERARLTALGKTPPFRDGQIAAIASTQGLVLVTRNTADFKGFGELQIEDWYR